MLGHHGGGSGKQPMPDAFPTCPQDAAPAQTGILFLQLDLPDSGDNDLTANTALLTFPLRFDTVH